MGPRTTTLIAAWGAFLCFAASHAHAQAPVSAPFQDHAIGGQCRDAVLHAGQGILYLALYDRDEIARVHPGSGELIDAIPVQAGPVSLALSADGSLLACANSLAGSVSLIDTGDAAVIAHAPVGKGPVSVAALPGGGFAVANSFSDSISVIDPAAPFEPAVIPNVASVPVAVSASSTHLAVAVSAPPGVHLYARGEASPEHVIPLEAEPLSLSAVGAGGFAAGTARGLAVIESEPGQIVKRAAMPLTSATVHGDAIYALSADTVTRLEADFSGKPETWRLNSAGRNIVAHAGGVFVCSPREQRWHGMLLRDLPEPAAAMAGDSEDRQSTPSPSPEPVEMTRSITEIEAGPPGSSQAASAPAASLSKPSGTRAESNANATESQPAEAAGESANAQVRTDQPATDEPATSAPAEARNQTRAPAPKAGSAPKGVFFGQPKPDSDGNANGGNPGHSKSSSAKPNAAYGMRKLASANPGHANSVSGESSGPFGVRKLASAGQAPFGSGSENMNEEAPQSEAPQGGTSGDASPGTASAGQYTVHRYPLQRTRLPSVQRPSAVPLPEVPELSFTEGLSQVPDFAIPSEIDIPDAEGGLDLRNADNTEYLPETDRLHATGNVEIVLGGTNFQMDEMMLDRDDGVLHAIGNVVVTQKQSRLEADELYYYLPEPMPEEEVESEEEAAEDAREQSPPFGAPEDEDGPSPYQRGSVTSRNVHLIEPHRELQAGQLIYDFDTGMGEATDVRGQVGVFYFGADRISLLGPENFEAENAWITTCDCDHEYYKIRFEELAMSEGELLTGDKLRLEVAGVQTPVYWPKWRFGAGLSRTSSLDFDSGRNADTGYFINFGQLFQVTDDIELGYRLYPTEKEGVGFGIESVYDFMQTPASPLFRSAGEFRSLYTTEDRGYIEWYHRHEILEDLVVLAQWEQWFDQEIIKDFYYSEFRNRTEPRTFVNATYTQPDYIATATVRKSTNGFVNETERLPEITYHLLERPLADDIYASFDSIAGYNSREPFGDRGLRTINVARLSYDWDLSQGWNLAPFVEADASWFGDEPGGNDSHGRMSPLAGVTLQGRYQRVFPGMLGFSAFKHIVSPSMTYSYRPDPTLAVEDIPLFDALDRLPGRSRIETKLDNIVLGRDAETDEVWQVGRLTLYQGNDFSNEFRETDDYEIELDLRPRPQWGAQLVAEHHGENDSLKFDRPFAFEQGLIRFYEVAVQPWTNHPLDQDILRRYNASRGDFDRILSLLYFDNSRSYDNLNGRVGISYTKTRNEVFNKEILYGLGYRINDNWSVAVEHRYDFERNDLVRQSYQVRRILDCITWALEVEDRESGIDFGFQLNLTAFPGTRLSF